MKKIVLLSGHSQRFIDEGYTIKPLIKIGEKTVLELVVDTIYTGENDYHDYMFVVKQEDVDEYDLDYYIESHFPECTVCVIESNREGPVKSIKQIFDEIPAYEEIVVSYCDLYISWDFQKDFLDKVHKDNCDGALASHAGWHPHRIHNKSFAYMKTTGDGQKVSRIKEKEFFEDPISEPASSGIYYFKTGIILKKYCDMLLEKGIKANNEFYITLPYNLMIDDHLEVRHYTSNNYFCFGTPRDVEIVKAFYYLQKHFNHCPISDVLDSQKYFRDFIMGC